MFTVGAIKTGQSEGKENEFFFKYGLNQGRQTGKSTARRSRSVQSLKNVDLKCLFR